MALEGAYAFNDIGSTTVVDLSGNGRHVNLSGQPGVQISSSGLLDGGALGKTGANTILLPSGLLAASETDNRTLMFDVLGTNSVWWLRWESTSLDTGVWGVLSLDASTVITRARTQANDSPTPNASTIGALSSTVRHNIATTYVRSTGVLSRYYDGALVGTQVFTAGTALYVGADELNMAEWSDTGPVIDNLRIFSHALTDLEVAALAGAPVTASAADVPGIGLSTLGGLTGVAVGSRDLAGNALATLGALVGTATGAINITGVMQSSLGGLLGVAIGKRDSTGVTSANLGGLSATATANVATFGTALAVLGTLTATASGIRSVSGTATASLDALTATASGIVSGAASGLAGLGPLTATAIGARNTTGSGVTSLGTLAASAIGIATEASTALVQLGPLLAVAVGARGVGGIALANLGPLIAIAIVPNPLPDTRLSVSGREPYHYANGREPRRLV